MATERKKKTMMKVELLQALKDIRDALDPDNPDSFRCDDPEGASDYAYEKARKAVEEYKP